jgi:Flp pilus assembly protein TadB
MIQRARRLISAGIGAISPLMVTSSRLNQACRRLIVCSAYLISLARLERVTVSRNSFCRFERKLPSMADTCALAICAGAPPQWVLNALTF